MVDLPGPKGATAKMLDAPNAPKVVPGKPGDDPVVRLLCVATRSSAKGMTIFPCYGVVVRPRCVSSVQNS